VPGETFKVLKLHNYVGAAQSSIIVLGIKELYSVLENIVLGAGEFRCYTSNILGATVS
jgi:hypothetical protein